MRNDGKTLYLTKDEYASLMSQGLASGIVHSGEEIVVTDNPKDHVSRIDTNSSLSPRSGVTDEPSQS